MPVEKAVQNGPLLYTRGKNATSKDKAKSKPKLF